MKKITKEQKTQREAKLQKEVMKVAKVVKVSSVSQKIRCISYSIWTIDMCEPDRTLEYPHLTVMTDISPDGKTHIRLLKIEIDTLWARKKILRKMLGMPGLGVLLCDKRSRIEQLIEAYPSVAMEAKIISDGVYFALHREFLMGGLFKTTFRATDGQEVKFLPVRLGPEGIEILSLANE
ncbi:MAG: hypothetical protein HZB31_04625 [Nitrospirae bacterium]|nr:hypothetical protein [Nitrospirota bacterium]